MHVIQERTLKLRGAALQALVDLIGDFERLARDGSAETLARARRLQRHAQFRIDFVEAENSMGFHAPQETARIIAEAIDLARQAQIVLSLIHISEPTRPY